MSEAWHADCWAATCTAVSATTVCFPELSEGLVVAVCTLFSAFFSVAAADRYPVVEAAVEATRSRASSATPSQLPASGVQQHHLTPAASRFGSTGVVPDMM